MRSRAVSRPRLCCRSTAAALPAWTASSRRDASSARRCSMECSMAPTLPEPPNPAQVRGRLLGDLRLLLDELDQGAEGALRVQESDGRPPRTRTGCLVDGP